MRNFSVLLLFCLIFLSCHSVNNKKSTINDYISVESVKEIVSKEIMESEYYQQFYVIDSPKYDERVKDVTWGDVFLVEDISAGEHNNGNMDYYLVSGVLPSGQVVALATIDAKTGKFREGANLLSEKSDKLVIMTPNECKNYLQTQGYEVNDIYPVYYNDGTVENSSLVYSWKYCASESNSCSKSARDLKISECIFVDPWINVGIESDEKSISNKNAYFSKFNYNHRLYKLETNEVYVRNLKNTSAKFIPLD